MWTQQSNAVHLRFVSSIGRNRYAASETVLTRR